MKRGDWIIIGDVHALACSYEPVVGMQAKVIGIRHNTIDVQVYDKQGNPTTIWYIDPADAQPIHQNNIAVSLLHLEL